MMCSRKSRHRIPQPKWTIGVAKSVHRRGQSQTRGSGVKLRVRDPRLLSAAYQRGGGECQDQKRIVLHGAISFSLLVEDLKHVVGGFLVVHEAQLLHQ